MSCGSGLAFCGLTRCDNGGWIWTRHVMHLGGQRTAALKPGDGHPEFVDSWDEGPTAYFLKGPGQLSESCGVGVRFGTLANGSVVL